MPKRAKNPGEASAEKDPLLEAVGARIQEARRELKLSQTQLAEKAGMTLSSVFQAENGLQNLTIKSLERFAVALGVEAKALLPDAGIAAEPDPASRVAKALVTELGRAVMLTKRVEDLAAALEAAVSGEGASSKG